MKFSLTGLFNLSVISLFMILLLSFIFINFISVVSAGAGKELKISVMVVDEEKNISVEREEINGDLEKIGLKTGFVSLDSGNETKADIMPVIIIICLFIVIYIISKQRITEK